MKNPSKPKFAALWMALATIYPLTAHSAAGVAQFAVGEVNVRRGAQAVPLAKGQPIESGDNITTGRAGQAQIRFSDGGLVSLAPNTEFNIDRYVDENDPDKDSFAVRFLRGGMRAITGLIGKRNQANYKVTTNTATIGIRGSAFSATQNSDGTLDVAGEQDAIEVCTNAGCVGLIVGEVVRVTSSDRLPTRTTLRSNVPPLVARRDLFAPVEPIPIRLVEFPTLPVTPEEPVQTRFPGLSAMLSLGNGGVENAPSGGAGPSDGVGDFDGRQLVQHSGTQAGSLSHAIASKTSAGAGSFGTAGAPADASFIGWGYWDEGAVQSSGLGNGTFAGVHYVVGRPTLQAQMPITGAASYLLLGGTDPTAWDGTNLRVGTLLGAGLNVDFGASRVSGYVHTSFLVNGQPFRVDVNGLAVLQGSVFNGTADGFAATQGYFNGFLVGPDAARAGLVYGIVDGTVGAVRGSAAFAKAGSGDAFTTQTGVSALFMPANQLYGDEYPRGGVDPSNGIGKFIGTALYSHESDPSYYGFSSLVASDRTTIANAGPTTVFGSIGNAADQDFAGWGYWTQATENGSPLAAGVHHVVGRPTTSEQMPMTGSVRYDLVGGTAPTAFQVEGGGPALMGQLMGAGLNVDFGASSVYAYVNTQFVRDAQTYAVQVSGAGYLYGSVFYGEGDYGSGMFNGFFIGNGATRAGLTYATTDPTLGYVNGAAVFSAAGAGDAMTQQSAMAGMFASGDGFVFDDFPRGGTYSGSALFIGTRLLSYDDQEGGYGGSSQFNTRVPVSNHGALGSPSDPDFIGWGYWAKGDLSGGSGNGSLSDVHYLVGRPTPNTQMPGAGTASYALSGGTAPTATYGGTSILGTLVGASLQANFSNGTFNATVDTQFTKAGATVPVSISTTNGYIAGSTLVGCGPDRMSGFFSGTLGARAGLVYSKSGTPVGTVRGAAVFTQSSSSGLALPD